jgi:acetyl esterase/lipase
LAAAILTQPAWAATPAPAAIGADPAPDARHPARLEQVRYPTDGVTVPARLFVAAGAGTHPTVLLLHGFPGTELNLDLARVLQRDGWNVMAIHYRGVWGAPGQFSYGHVIADSHAALAWLRSPAAAPYGIDPARIVVLGHSMGGFATVMAGDDRAVKGYVLISPADMVQWTIASTAPGADSSEFADDASYTNASIGALGDEARAHGADWDWKTHAAQMAPRPVLVITSDDGIAASGTAAAHAVTAAHGRARLVHFATDHSYNDHRVALARTVVSWLNTQFPRH